MTHCAWPQPSILRKIAEVDREAPKHIFDAFEKIAADRRAHEEKQQAASAKKRGMGILVRSFIEGLTFQTPRITLSSPYMFPNQNPHGSANDLKRALRDYLDENDWQIKLTRSEVQSLEMT